jgi:hypothetical protein
LTRLAGLLNSKCIKAYGAARGAESRISVEEARRDGGAEGDKTDRHDREGSAR